MAPFFSFRHPSPGRAASPMLLQWHVTERCNLACTHCYQEAWPAPELDWDGLLLVLDQFREFMKERGAGAAGQAARGQIVLTGGEPFIRPDFMDLIERIAAEREWTGFAILTNGSLIDAALANSLRGLRPDYVQVSVEGTEATHDAIRGPGSWRKTVAAARLLVGAGIRTMIGFTAHRGNYREFPAVAELGRRLGVSRVWADRLVPLGGGARMQTLSPDETRRFMELMRRAAAPGCFRAAASTEVARHRALQFRAGGGRPYHCTAGDTLVAVMPNGDLYPCRRLPLRVGNLLARPLADLHRESELLAALRDRRRICTGCEECLYVGLCRGGLRCLAHAVSGDPFIRDPGCWREAAGAAVPAEQASTLITREKG